MAVRKKKKPFNAVAAAAALAAGAITKQGSNLATEYLDDTPENSLMIDLGSAILGSAVIYFSNDETVKSAGYGILGAAGAGASDEIKDLITGDERSGETQARQIVQRNLAQLAENAGAAANNVMKSTASAVESTLQIPVQNAMRTLAMQESMTG